MDSLRIVWTNTNEDNSKRFKAIGAYYKEYSNFQLDSTLNLANYHYNLAKTNNNRNQMVVALNKKANIICLLNDYKGALKYFNEAENLVNKIENNNLKALVIGDKGIALSKLERYSEALKQYTKALETYKAGENKLGQARMLNNIAGIYYIIENYDLALKYYGESLGIFKSFEESNRRIAVLYLNLGNINQKKKKYPEALSNFNQALQISKDNKDTYFIAAGNYSLASLYDEINNLELAKSYAYNSIDTKKKLNNEADVKEETLLLAKIEFEENPKLAEKEAEKLLNKLSENSSNSFKKNLYKLLYDCYKSGGSTNKALEVYEKYVTINESINERKNKLSLIREVIKNDFEIQLYETQLKNDKIQSELRVKQLRNIFLILFFSGLIIGGVTHYFRVQNLKNKSKLKELLLELEQLKSSRDFKITSSEEQKFLDRERIEKSIERKLNDTDWRVLNVLIKDPVIQNKEIAKEVYLSVDGIGSSLRRMYDYFEIRETKYKKIALLNDAVKRSKAA
ncbi:Winged helix-turn-helix DNA-binding [Winogradskyella jejuensis]|uniref:Winged helix-turn-helix DNA-binding n=2 Tax=Winogradskyella jejuensis TaxID=1089305 RepID=A0A1M5SQR4_9FLAO|nr:Winged helix-turn-helix DNA-binding [Winogradskyella jejuensis]